MTTSALLALEDGSIFRGVAIGKMKTTTGEIVFNTAMTGYQEILTDPSYHQQIVTLTHPHIGNVGVNSSDEESGKMHISGLVLRDLPKTYSNWRGELSLPDYLKQNNIPAICNIDTRRLTTILRDKGAQRGCLMASDIDPKTAIELAQASPKLIGADLAQTVSTKKIYDWHGGCWQSAPTLGKVKQPLRLIAYDFGIKRNLLRIFYDLGCKVTVVPATTTAEYVLAECPDGIFLSNGPGDPGPCGYAIDAIRVFLSKKVPLFGVCLGYQLLALACGARTFKMKFGHHGANHPVLCLDTGKVTVSSQNHSFAVSEEDFPADLIITHRSLFDNSLQGYRHRTLPAFGFQGHPEGSPGPKDLKSLFQYFLMLMNQYRKINAKT